MSAADRNPPEPSAAVFELESQLLEAGDDAARTQLAFLALVVTILLIVTAPALVVIAYRAAF